MRSSLERAINIEDLRRLAQRALPKMLFDYVDGGSDDERGIRRNREAFDRWTLVPRYLRDVTQRSTVTSLLGTEYAAPFGISPTGFAGLLRPGADYMLAQAASLAKLPFILSGVSNSTLEEIGEQAGGALWYQLYPSRDRSISDDIVQRVAAAGVEHLVVTIDLPVVSNRERDIRNGFGFPPKIKASAYLETLRHPAWCWRYIASGKYPVFADWTRYAGQSPTPAKVAQLVKDNSPAVMTWNDVQRLRDRWPGKLVLKGILHAEDAVIARRHGVDGLIVSNHGGRQLDRAVTSIDALPVIRRAVGPDYPLMLDSGVRRGSDIAIALCLGADFVFAGRPTLFGVAAAGHMGATQAISILQSEFDRVLGQLGASNISMLDPTFVSSMPQTQQNAP
ncbi:alpha-hydroxy acid oxidase [Caballeronia sp. 15715]|uniref:alpha-hydroxy acid oxidase n=1 Tax=Caballeronia sp. 15715 TaxID=3391030 RepID=UPI0039E4D949